MTATTHATPGPCPGTCEKKTGDNRPLVGLPANYSDTDETRILLTPEGCGMLGALGFAIAVERGVGIDISYSDDEYRNHGARLVTRQEAFRADVVICTEVPRIEDIANMRPGSALFCFMDSPLFERERIEALNANEITCLCLDNLISTNGEPIFANIIDELDGRAAVMYAQDELSFLGGGRGILLSGAAGVNPCEVLIIGQGWRAVSAAKAALNAGAHVMLMDNDISALQDAKSICGDQLATSALNPRVVFNAVKSADVIFLDHCSRNYELPKEMSMAMKEKVYLLDFTQTHPSLSVPRTVAMAMSNLLVNLMHDLIYSGGTDNLIISTMGVQAGIVTYHGHLTNKLIGLNTGIQAVDLELITGPIN